jgi:hypothetical protein
MAVRRRETLAAIVEFLCDDPAAKLVAQGDSYVPAGAPVTSKFGSLPLYVVKELASRGLLEKGETGSYTATPAAATFVARIRNPDRPFQAQHAVLEAAETDADRAGSTVLRNLAESPISLLARRSRGSSEAPWLEAHAVAAAERLRRDFELAQLQPRITANWSASVNRGRRSANGSDAAELSEIAIAARIRFDRAIKNAGPELAGVLIDVCCFVKGLETVERERRWPARSAKLVLRIALESLARHYGLNAAATGSHSTHTRHWGAADYRPEIT